MWRRVEQVQRMMGFVEYMNIFITLEFNYILRKTQATLQSSESRHKCGIFTVLFILTISPLTKDGIEREMSVCVSIREAETLGQ